MDFQIRRENTFLRQGQRTSDRAVANEGKRHNLHGSETRPCRRIKAGDRACGQEFLPGIPRDA